MNLPPLTVIEASAGTGKTFSLVTRLLELIFAGVEPERIVALTFSRMAAGEIFNSFIERLARAAGDNCAAAEEASRLSRNLTRADFAAMLRKVISRQHLSLIGTLDSFLMRIVRMVPLELGLGGEVSVMSDYRSPVEQQRLVGELMALEGDDAKSVLREAFLLTLGTVGASRLLKSFSECIAHWHGRYRDRPAAAQWGEPSVIWGGDPPAGLDVTLAEIRASSAALERFRGKKGADKFIDSVAAFSGAALPDMPKCMDGDVDAGRSLSMMRRWRIARALEITRGAYRLMRAYDAAYASKIRAKGLVAFEDMPVLLKSLERGDRLALEYRMDARFDHWALDEFQDTSRSQWQVIGDLIDESAQSTEGKTVFIVGDRKQSIYEWRGGDVRILGEAAARASLPGNRLVPLDLSRRYLPAISRAVNRVFGEATVQGAFDMDDAPSGAKWLCRDHISHDTSQDGFVEVIEARKNGTKAAQSDFFEPVANALMAVRPWERGLTCAILVRKNAFGEAILAYLKSRGIDKVVFEGESGVADCPALSAIAELVTLAEHPADAYAYAHIVHSPLAQALWPAGMKDIAATAAELLSEFTRKGLVRKLREVRESLKRVPDTWNAFVESRFEDAIKCAAEFEAARDSRTRLSDFTDYLAQRTRRDFAEAGMVRVMTMHQSKGLGFDYVLLPLYEPDGLVDSRHTGPLESESPDWIVENPGPDVAASDATLGAAERRRQHAARYGSLCLDYVAMTRAKKALTLILHPANKKPPAVPAKFSDLARLVGLKTDGDREWYLKAAASPAARAAEPARREASAPPRKPRVEIAKVRPSESFYRGLRGDVLFTEGFGAAAMHGTAVHERFEKIEWIDAASAAGAIEREFVRPSPDAEVWRERAYERYVDGIWESGQFDRVVFWRDAQGARAKICDFKTNAVRAGESADAFAERMRETYRSQMAAYRTALSALCGLPSSRIELKLLLVATGAVVEV